MYLAESVRNVLSVRICRPRFGHHIEGAPGTGSPGGPSMSSSFGVVSGRFPEEANFSGSFVGCERRSHLGRRCRVSVTIPDLSMPPRNARGSSRSVSAPWPDSRASQDERQRATAVPMNVTRDWISLLDMDGDKEMIGTGNRSRFDRPPRGSSALRRSTEEESQKVWGVQSRLRITDNQRAEELFRPRTIPHDREAPRLSRDRFFSGG
jgi:hypothetical protein